MAKGGKTSGTGKSGSGRADAFIENRRARFDFAITDTFECGIVLKGSEVKSLRDGQASIAEGFVRVELGVLRGAPTARARVPAKQSSPKTPSNAIPSKGQTTPAAPVKPSTPAPKPSRRRIEPGLYLHGAMIAEYPPAGPTGSAGQHKPTRVRTLLVHKKELEKMAKEVATKGFTLVPIKLYFKNGKAKLLVGLGKSKTRSDKRESITKRDAQRDMARAMSKKL